MLLFFGIRFVGINNSDSNSSAALPITETTVAGDYSDETVKAKYKEFDKKAKLID